MAESKGLKTQISIIDNMSGVISRINSNLGTMMTVMRNVDSATDAGFDTDTINAFESAIQDSQMACQQLNNQLNSVNGQAFNGLTQGALVFSNVMGNIITKAGQMAVSAISNTISSSIEAYNVQKNAETQLMSVLQNTSDNALESYNRILAKSKEIQANGIYGDEGMVAAGAEFATYFSDTDAIESMMDTLSNYAMGMSGGGALDSKALVDYATNIAKLTTGAYDAMTKKGFEVTETQKAILKGTATQQQLIEELGESYATMTDDMQKATVINSIIAESWDGLYEKMSNTPEGKIISLANAWGDLKEEMGGQIQLGLQAINQALTDNWSTIEIVVHAFSDALQLILVGAGQIINVAMQIAQVIVDNWSWLQYIVLGVAAAFAAYAVQLGIVAIAHGIEAVATFAATAAQVGLNAALAACPIVWIIAAVGALIGLIIIILQKIAEMTGAAGSFFGLITGGLNVVKQTVMNVIDFVGAVFYNLYAGIVNIIKDLQGHFWGLMATVMEVVKGIVDKLNILPFIDIDVSGITNAAEDFRAKEQAAYDSKLEYKNPLESFQKEDWIGQSFREGAAWGDGIVNDITSGIDSVLNPALGQDSMLNQNIGNIAQSTQGIENTLNTDNEEMAYLKDLAEQETINRFTTAEIRVDMGGISQNISRDTDADSVIDYLVKSVNQGMQSVAEGVYA